MLAVYKYPVQVDDRFSLDLPVGARLLHVDMQYGSVQLWALVDPKAPVEIVWFRFAGTGHPIEERDAGEHVGTFSMQGGTLVFHLFRCKEVK